MKLHNIPYEPYHFPILFKNIKPQTNTQGHVTRLLLGASLGPQVKDHTTRLLLGASLGPQISCVTTRSFVRPTGRL
jgi:hypothetical protein